jgi:hypothetical protein
MGLSSVFCDFSDRFLDHLLVLDGTGNGFLFSSEILLGEHTLLADLLGDKDLEEVVGQLIELNDGGERSANDDLVSLEYSDGSVDLDILKLFVLPVGKHVGGSLVVFLVEHHFEGSSVVVNSQNGPHSVDLLLEDPPDHDEVLELLAVEIADIVSLDLAVEHHLHGHWRKNSLFPFLGLLFSLVLHLVVVSVVLSKASLVGHHVVGTAGELQKYKLAWSVDGSVLTMWRKPGLIKLH